MHNELSRRSVLKGVLAAGAGAALARLGLSESAIAELTKAPLKPGKAKAVIQIWMWGGPSHIDTFDPKPKAGSVYTGPLTGTCKTNVAGVEIGQLLPELAKRADMYSILRAMTHGVNGHETASYMVQSGWKPGRDTHPSVGAVVSYYLGYRNGYKGVIPPYVVLTKPQGRFSEAGFLGSKYKPFATGGDPARTPFLVEGISAPGISRAQQSSRRKFLGSVDTLAQQLAKDPAIRDHQDATDKAYDLILGDAGKVFDLGQEPKRLRDKYGRNTFGQSCLMARRLIENGVKYVTINSQGWDTHKKHFQTMNRRLPQMDQGMATLLGDLKSRGLLDSTIVWWGGEFGRGPKVQLEAPWNGGRSHFGACFSHVLAGGGFSGGHVIGESDDRAMAVKDRPVYPWDMTASLYGQLGIPADATLRHPAGRLLPLLPTNEKGYVSGGTLKELTG